MGSIANNSSTRWLLPGGVVVLLVLAWFAHFALEDLRQERQLLRQERKPPYILNGLSFDNVAQGTTILDASPNRPVSNGRRLVIALADDCPFCERALPQIERLVSESVWNGSQEAWIFTFDGRDFADRIARSLQRAGAPYKIFAVNHSLSFGTRTGIVATPRIILLDSDKKVLLVAVSLDDQRVSIFKRYLGAAAPPIATRPDESHEVTTPERARQPLRHRTGRPQEEVPLASRFALTSPKSLQTNQGENR